MLRMNKTLLNELFDNPNPQPHYPEVKRSYNVLYNRIFPGDYLFIEYLKSQTFDKQYEYAEKIIHRLCFESNFPPTYFALKDVITLEEYQNDRAGENSAHISRDHFAHTVNLYIFGIYVFFYNSEFYKKIVLDNRYERTDMSHNQPKLDCVKDFISQWKYFCLYHDIGYVQELFGGNDYIKNARISYSELCKRQSDFQASLISNVAVNQISFFGTVEIMARILTWELVKSYSSEKNDKNSKIFKRLEKGLYTYTESMELIKVSFKDEIAPLINLVYRIEKIYSNKCLKGILPIIGEDNVFVVGIYKNTGDLGFISYVKEGKRLIAFSYKFSNSKDIIRLYQDPSLILFDDFVPDDFELEYLVDYEKSDKQFEENILYEKSYLENALLYIQKSEMGIHFAGITSEQQMLDFYFDIYEYLYTTLRKFISPGKDIKASSYAKKYDTFINEWNDIFEMDTVCTFEKNSELNKIVFGLLQNAYTEDVKRECVSYFQNLKPVDKKGKKNSENSAPKSLIENIINGYFDVIEEIIKSEDKKKRLVAQIDDNYNNKIEQTGALIKIYAYQYAGLKSILLKNGGFKYSFIYEKREELIDWNCCKTLFQKKVDKKLKKPCDCIAKEYSLKHSKYDHGVSSTGYAAAMFDILRESIKAKKNPKEWKIIDILFSISNPRKTEDYIGQYITNYDHIFENTLFAIFVHNVYPSKAKEGSVLRKYKTKISDPFTYFSLICDALQQWNRPMSISPSLLDVRPCEYVSEDYNIIVRADGIYLYEQGEEKYQNALNNNINGMTHMEGVKAFLKNKYVMTGD